MKIKRIKKILESLNAEELIQVASLVENPYSKLSYSYNEIIKIAEKIRSGELEENKDFLMLQDENGYSVASWLAWSSDRTGWSTNDRDILMLQDKKRFSIAHELAFWHPTWTTEDLEILSLKDNEETTVEDILVVKGKI